MILPDVDRLQRSAASVMTVRGGLHVDHNLRYAVLVVRLTRRIAQAMSLPRDLLLMFIPVNSSVEPGSAMQLITSYADQRRELDNRFAFVLAPFPREDVRLLKTLGRRNNVELVYIPWSAVGSSTDDFERALSLDLFASDPFDVTSPVSEDTDFYGRRSEVLQLARQLEAGRIKSLFALRRAGKTSVLDRIQKIGASQRSFLSVMLDLQDERLSTLAGGELVDVVRSGLIEATASPYGYASASSSDLGYTTEDELWHQLRLTGKPAVILVDEVDDMVPVDLDGPEAREFEGFWRLMRRMFQESPRQGCTLGLIVAGVSSHAFRSPLMAGIENSARRLVPDEYLPPFARPASIAMVQGLGARCGILFGDREAAIVAELCGDLPYWMRQAGSWINSRVDATQRPHRVTQPDTHALATEYIDDTGRRDLADDLLSWVRRTPVAGQALASIARGVTSGNDVLSAYGLTIAGKPSSLVQRAVETMSDRGDLDLG